ncbi:hypothetical protein A2121_02530 [Candidatus Nomurabacteria bacterium GWB1_40_6]|uniref:Uncharacterized protein n=1 Tax=Candidatus Nomurabacteria bacterium GWB1_40_6 TaxID=1801727 RepID=A0A1F6TM60_9BACT|nr:MAG: hypothetical protein A2121_02530 [Candidatus Nomurabacteria bacterium GWB1_40_6]
MCLGLVQIILKCLARLTILQLSQIFFTDDFIFIKNFFPRSFVQKDYITEEKQGNTLIFSAL